MNSLLGYVDRWSAQPGETLSFMVSCSGVDRYTAELFRLRQPDAGPQATPFRPEPVAAPCNGVYAGRHQGVAVGSLAIVDHSGTWLDGSFTLMAYVKPTTPAKGRQALLGTWNEAEGTGYGLELGDDGALQLRVSSTSDPIVVTTGVALHTRWYLVAGAWDAAASTITLWQEPLDDHDFHTERAVSVQASVAGTALSSNSPLTMAAWNCGAAEGPSAWGGCRFDYHFNGCIDRPRLVTGALTRSELHLLDSSPRCEELAGRLVAAWDFSRETNGDTIVDTGLGGLHGRLVNQPTRGMPGHNWNEAETNWTKAPEQYGAIHFHDDDLSDARWLPDFFFTIPSGMRSGVYGARLSTQHVEFWIPFVVRPASGQSSAHTVVLLPTATYQAYQNHRGRFMSLANERLHGRLNVIDAIDMMFLDLPPIGLSTYDRHSDGSGVAYTSRHRPAQNIRPTGRLWNFSVDLFIIDWLEYLGTGYDVITDEDLHTEGQSIISAYSVVITGSHSEYASLQMLDALEGYLRAGGRLMSMGGNGFYWRVAFHSEHPGIMEVRRSEGVRAWDAQPGSSHMSFTGERGGLWRANQRAPQRLTGCGFIGQGFDRSSYYRRTPQSYERRFAWAFAGITEELIGDFGHLQGGAAGIELDACNYALGTPAHAVVLGHSENHSNNYELAGEEVLVPHGATDGAINPDVRADMVFFETTSGGAVFATGSIAYAGALSWHNFDNNIAQLTANVLRRFLDPAPFEVSCGGIKPASR